MEPVITNPSTTAWTDLLETLTDSEVTNLLTELSKHANQSVESHRLPPPERIKHLREAYVNGRLVLALGAGVSMDLGLPNWNTLLQQLIVKTMADETEDRHDEYVVKQRSLPVARLFNQVFRPSPLIAARYLRLRLGEDFEKAVREVVYRDLNLSERAPLLEEIRQLCVSPGRNPNLNAVITYNYDDLLETYLEELPIKVPYRPIYAVGMNPEPDELPIYHIHGYLPRETQLGPENKITLSEDVYHRQYEDIYGWNNIVQINKFRDYTCLFVGTSFTDPNLRRLLDIAARQRGRDHPIQHYIIRIRYKAAQIQDQISKELEANNELLHDKVRANLSLEDTTENLVELMSNFEEEDARSFGVETIWVKDYTDVVEVLRKIQNR